MTRRLRILLTILIAVLGLLVVRVESMRRSAVFHEREAERYFQMIGTFFNVTPEEVDLALEVAANDPDDFRIDRKFHVVLHHQASADLYRHAVYRPWTVVHESPLPEQDYED